jgi:hypothetical protein
MCQRDSSGWQLSGLGHVHAAGERHVQKRLAEVHRCRGRESSKGEADWGRINGSIAHRVPHCDLHRNTDSYSDANCHGHRRPICYRHRDRDFRRNRECDLDCQLNLHGNVDGNFNSDRIADAYDDRGRNRVGDGNRDHIRICNFDPESDANRNRERDDDRDCDSDTDSNRDAHVNRNFNRVSDADRDYHSNLQRGLRDFVEFQR